MQNITMFAVPGIPLVQPGDDLADLILAGLESAGLRLQDGDVLVIAQKVVSKAEGRIVALADVTPSEHAREVAAIVDKDPRLVQVILDESNEVVRMAEGVLIVEQRYGFICANAGVDRSNVGPDHGERVTLLPEDPDRSAQQIRARLMTRTGRDVAVIINDSHGRPWRVGTAGVAIGVAGMNPVDDLRGHPDLFGYTLRITQVGTADQIAAAASLLQGQADEGRPVILVRGVPYTRGEGSARDLLRPRERDLFR